MVFAFIRGSGQIISNPAILINYRILCADICFPWGVNKSGGRERKHFVGTRRLHAQSKKKPSNLPGFQASNFFPRNLTILGFAHRD